MKIWRRFNGEYLAVPIKEEVETLILREKAAGNKLKICIGTDSEVQGAKVEFATVIVFLREKKGGFMLINNEVTHQIMPIKERLLNEVARSIEISFALCDLLEKHGLDLEVHADINTNPNFKSNPALNEAMGYILGMGFAFKAKPHAFASSCCADKVI
ncbi:ribonuclease H-like YkuK family protein [soil metagenome]